MRSALVLRHVAHEGLGGFEAPVRAAGYSIAIVDPSSAEFDEHDLGEPDLVIVLGGPMAAYDTGRNGWIAPEIARIAARLADDQPTLGICLGSQMLAAALGAHVEPGPAKEVGFAPIALTAAGRKSPLRHLDGLPMLHWHGDGFGIPVGCERLASSALFQNQAFRRGANILALQFHAEVDPPTLDVWIGRAGGYLEAAGTDAETLRSDAARHSTAMLDGGAKMLSEWLAGLPG